MSHITMFPSTRKKWNKRMIESIRAIRPRPTYLDKAEVKNEKTGKLETKIVRKVLSDNDITKLVKSNYNLSSDRPTKSVVVTPTAETSTEE